MTVEPDWEAAFLAVSTLLGEPLDVAATALTDGGARVLAGPLGSSARNVRAAAVARAVAGVVAELEGARLT